MQLTIIILLLTTVVATLGLSALIIKSSKSSYAWQFVIVSTSVALWAIGDLIMLFATNITMAYFGTMIFYIAPLITPVALIGFAKLFPDNNQKHFLIIEASVFVTASMLLIILANNFIDIIDISSTPNTTIPSIEYFKVYSVFLIVTFIYGYFVFINRIRHTTGKVRTQIIYTFSGGLISSNIALYTNVVLPLNGTYDLVWVGPPATLITVLTIAFAIIKYRLFDVRATVARGLAYISFVSLIGFVYVLAVSFVGTYIFKREDIRPIDLTINAIAALIVAFTFGPLKARFDKYTNRIFFRDAYDPQDFLNQLNAVLVSVSDINEILKKSSKLIGEHIKPTVTAAIIQEPNQKNIYLYTTKKLHFNKVDLKHITKRKHNLQDRTIYLDEADKDIEINKILSSNNIGLVTKLIANNEFIGLLMLGERKSGNGYRQRDIQLLETAADSIAIATQNALRYEEIAAFNVSLQKKVETATKELQETNDKLREMDATKDDFISMASHQLRTPLTSVKGYISMVMDGDAGKINEDQKTFLNQAFISSQRMVYLISDLLNASRLRTGKFIIEPSKINLESLVDFEIEQLTPTASARDISINFKASKKLPEVLLDENKIGQVIMNFLDNAIFYTNKGGKINIELKATEKEIIFTVTDTGIGVSKKEQPLLFTKFFRADNAKKARPDGTGIGIYMAKKVIIAHGGSLIFRSIENVGSTFGFSFARSKIEASNSLPTNLNSLKPVGVRSSKKYSKSKQLTTTVKVNSFIY